MVHIVEFYPCAIHFHFDCCRLDRGPFHLFEYLHSLDHQGLGLGQVSRRAFPRFGLGVELSRARLLGKEAPLRFGFRRTGLPFSFDEGGAIEQVISGGFGLELSRVGDIVLASVDLAIERGRRTGAGLSENFWRATISLLASGL